MIQELSEKTFKLNLETPFEKSIIMKKREIATKTSNNNDEINKKTKIVEN